MCLNGLSGFEFISLVFSEFELISRKRRIEKGERHCEVNLGFGVELRALGLVGPAIKCPIKGGGRFRLE